MKHTIYQVDAFTDKVFGGNPACVMMLADWLPDDVLLKIAAENGVAETAYFTDKDGVLSLRWFTPEIEMDLCGHATLATAHVLFHDLHYPNDTIVFQSASGPLTVVREGDSIVLNFPARDAKPDELPPIIARSMNIAPREVYRARDFVLVYASEQEIISLKPDRSVLDQINLDPGGIIVTAPGTTVDFVSRFFTPQASIFEDPVTGSAHCSLIPFWAQRLGKNKLEACQLSARVGVLSCEWLNERVLIKGKAVTYLTGEIDI